VALLPDYLAELEVGRNNLVVPYGGARLVEGKYYLVWPCAAPVRPPLATFVGWLRGQI